MAINFYEDLTVYNHVYVEGGFYAGTAVDTNYDLKIKGASLLQSTLAVSGIVTLSSVANASSDPDKFLCINGSNQVEYRTGAQVLSDIGAASSSSLSNYLPLAGGTMTGAIDMDNNNLVDVGDFNIPTTLTIQAGGDITVGGSTTFQSTTDFEADSSWTDNSKVKLGSGNDLKIYHDGTDSVIQNDTGDLEIQNRQNDGDIVFKSDDGSGGVTTYFFLDGSTASSGSLYTQFPDNSNLTFGASNDLRIYHNGTNSNIENFGGTLQMVQNVNDGDIKFLCDNGSGGTAEYFKLDGSAASGGYLYTSFPDQSTLSLGDSLDFNMFHFGNTFLNNETGDLYITNSANDKDVLFRSDDGAGGVATYFYLDGSLSINVFSKSVRFDANSNFGDNIKARFGASNDLEIYHNGSNSIIEDTGTGDLVLKFSNDLLIEGQDGANLINCNEGNSVQLYYNGSEKLETKSTGIEVTGDVLDRDIPCLFNSNFFDGTGASIYVVPFNSLSEVTISSRTYYHNLTMPYAGKLVKVVMKNVSGTLGSGFTTQLFLYVNGSQQASSAELSISNSAVTWTPTTSNTFSAGDELSFAYQKSAAGTGITWAGVSFGVAIELTDYDI